MKNTYLALVVSVLFFSCGPSSNEKTVDSKKTEIVFKPSTGDKKTMAYEFSCKAPSDSTDITFFIDLGLEVAAAKSGNNNIHVTYTKICAKGNTGRLKADVCAGDAIDTALMKAVSSVFGYRNAVYNMQFDDRMRKASESVVAIDSSVSTMAPPIGKMQFFTVLPSGPVAVGDSWKEELDLSGANKKKAMVTYTLTKIENNVAYISFKGTVTAKGEGFGQEFSMTSTLNGTIEVDCNTGWTLFGERKENVVLFSDGKENEVLFTYRMKLK